MKLTAAEKQLILDKRAEEEKDLPKLTGILKEDLYVVDRQKIDIPWLVTKSQKQEIISKFDANFELAVTAGSEFIAFIEDDGDEQWYDNDYGIEGMSAKWAREHLVDIKPIKKTKKKRSG